jgi:hypothetical protein
MSLRNFKFWNAVPAANVAPEAAPSESDPSDAVDNVVQLPLDTPVDNPAGFASEPVTPLESNPSSAAHSKTNTPAGLMAASELQAFFDNNFFGLGRHNGSHYKTQEAQTQGKAALVSQFQNAVEVVIGQKLAKVDALRNMELQTDGVCHTATSQLRLACTRLERDMASLQNQIDLADQGKGWVLAALNEYQIGFGKGLRQAIDAEVLGL